MVEALLAQAAVNLLVGKTVEGVLTTIGSDAYKAGLEALKGFFSWKFAGKPELAKVNENPKALESLVEKKALAEEDFRKELEKLVNQLQEAIKNVPDATTSYSNVGSVANQNIDSVSGSTVAGRDAIGGNQNNVGGNQSNSTFHQRQI
jgi:hypothetical protein